MLFTVTEEMHTWAVKAKQHCTRGGEGHGAKLKTAFKCLNTFVRGYTLFCGGSEKSRFQWLYKEQFQFFFNFTYEDYFTVSLISF